MRTYNQTDWLASLAEWDAGKFSPEWKRYRHAAAMRGMIYPPIGSRFDSWEDEEPSQRAMLVRAIRETPELLMHSIETSKSWGEVLTKILRARDEWRADLNQRQRELGYERDEPDAHEATVLLKHILERIGAS